MDKIQIVASSNNEYVPFLSVMIRSLMDHADSRRYYVITVLNMDITEENKSVLEGMLCDNFRIVFADVNEYMNKYLDLYISNHIKIETYFRLLLPKLMQSVDKVLYIDCDVIANSDVSQLYDMEIDDNFLAGTRDADSSANYNKDEDYKIYIDEVLKLSNPYDYVQAGILLMNLNKFRKELNSDKLMNIAHSKEWKFHDQDVLNYTCKDSIKFIDYSWNFVYDYNESNRRSINQLADAPEFIRSDYLRAKKNPHIIHFSWIDKPWFSPGVHFGEKWWMTARKSPYYSNILLGTESSLIKYMIWK